ncbi:MAG: hypothetical protein IJ092_10165 [Atopobiaceae bacterium]|nr:hypothetical protein [Atopobiaceae bacterium]
MASSVQHQSSDIRSDVDRFCAGSNPPTNGLEERLDMLVAQMAVIASELHELNERLKWMR